MMVHVMYMSTKRRNQEKWQRRNEVCSFASLFSNHSEAVTLCTQELLIQHPSDWRISRALVSQQSWQSRPRQHRVMTQWQCLSWYRCCQHKLRYTFCTFCSLSLANFAPKFDCLFFLHVREDHEMWDVCYLSYLSLWFDILVVLGEIYPSFKNHQRFGS